MVALQGETKVSPLLLGLALSLYVSENKQKMAAALRKDKESKLFAEFTTGYCLTRPADLQYYH